MELSKRKLYISRNVETMELWKSKSKTNYAANLVWQKNNKHVRWAYGWGFLQLHLRGRNQRKVERRVRFFKFSLNGVVLTIFLRKNPIRVLRTVQVIGFAQIRPGLTGSYQARCTASPITKPVQLWHRVPIWSGRVGPDFWTMIKS